MKIHVRIMLSAVLLGSSIASGWAGNISARMIIAGPGDPLYTYWGHIGLALKNNDTGEDLFYDFGNFSFYSENFYEDFIKGYMPYLAVVSPTNRFIAQSMLKNMDLTMYNLNLGHEELEMLDKKLRWWVLPENRVYLYNYFTNNCSTIIRDILNEVLDNQLKDQTISIKDKSFRYYARTLSYQSLPAEIMFHYLLGPYTDKTINGWELMFLPFAVADYATRLEYTGQDGVIRTLSDEKTILKKAIRPPVPDKPTKLWPLLLCVSLFMSIVWFQASNLKWGGLIQLPIVLIVGLPGAAIGFFMFFTNHNAGYGNINFWSTLPTVLLCVIPLFASRWKYQESVIAWIWTINAIGLISSVYLRLSGEVYQDVSAFWALYGPITLAASYPGLLLKRRLGW